MRLIGPCAYLPAGLGRPLEVGWAAMKRAPGRGARRPCACAGRGVRRCAVGILCKPKSRQAAFTVALWAGEPFDLRELVGVLLVRSRGLEPHSVTR
jgi:hypothetical protein